jgi:uncharacterized HhH-GPD family protein
MNVWQATGMPSLYLSQQPAADKLLATDPLALLIGMLLDQQIPLEKAFVGPYVLTERLGVDRLDAAALAAHDPDDFTRICSTPPALHRFPAAMAERIQKLCQVIVDEFGADPASVWSEAKDGPDLVKRVGRLPGFGKQKAQIFVALLGKQMGVRPRGWREAAGEYGPNGTFKSVADIVDDASLSKVRTYKKEMKAAAKAGKG